MLTKEPPAKRGRKATGARPMTISLLPAHIELLKQHLDRTGESYSETIRKGIVLITKTK